MKQPRRTSPVLVASAAVLVTATVFASGGASVAAKLITGKDIKNGSVASVDIKNGTVTGTDVKNGSLGRADLQPGATVDTVIPRKRVVASSGPTEADARTTASPVLLFRKGSLTVYGKCFTATAGPTTYSEVYIRSSANGAIFDSREDSLDGGPTAAEFLNTNTPETDATIESNNTGVNSSSMDSEDDSDFTAFGTDGTTLRGWTGMAVKNGTLAGGNGVYGAGNVCLFTGTITAN